MLHALKLKCFMYMHACIYHIYIYEYRLPLRPSFVQVALVSVFAVGRLGMCRSMFAHLQRAEVQRLVDDGGQKSGTTEGQGLPTPLVTPYSYI